MHSRELEELLREIRACRICESHLPCFPRPVLQASASAVILIAGQAPGRTVQETGIPWDDASGERLRDWLRISSEEFYDRSQVALIPMGFCYPGKRSGGDAPPRPECRANWHPKLLPLLANIRLTILVGQYAQAYHLPSRRPSLTKTVAAWSHWTPALVPLPHPSPRNAYWLRKNPWFERELLPVVRGLVRIALASG